MSVPTRGEVELMLAERIWDDPAFRDEVLADPRAAISGLIDMPIPDSVRIELHEESLTTIHFTIPTAGGITDDDLALVGGGWSGGGYSGPSNCAGG